MREQIDFIIDFLKNQKNVRGCITGSSLLGEYWDYMDVDLFVYDETSLNKILNILDFDKRFQILDKKEQWKFDQQINIPNTGNKKKNFIQTIKFTYNTAIPVNIIFKPFARNIYEVLSSFDMDIVAIGYDLQTKQTLDLGNINNRKNKIADWNKYNIAFYSNNLWDEQKLLRQLDRIFKYYKRGYNTDLVVLKYIEIMDNLKNYHNIFKDAKVFTNKLKIIKENITIIKKICNLWLQNHTITEDELKLIHIKMLELTN